MADNEVAQEPQGALLFQQALLKEYELCQQSVSSSATRSLSTAGVAYGLSLAGISVLAAKQTLSIVDFLISLGGGVLFILVLGRLAGALERETFVRRVKYHRMHEIEKSLNLKANLYVKLLDEREHVEDMQQLEERYRPPISFVSLEIPRLLQYTWFVFTVVQTLRYGLGQ